MIPSSHRRLWTFLLVSLLAFYLPDLLLPSSIQATPGYRLAGQVYLGALVTGLFLFAPALCGAMVVREIPAPALEVQRLMAGAPTVVLFEHPAPYVLTAGLLPRQCRVYLSTGLMQRLTPGALAFLLGRAAAHASPFHRLVAYLPLLAFTVLVPDDPAQVDWPLLLAGLAGWLALHWWAELLADRYAAQRMETGASVALQQLESAAAVRASWLRFQPPRSWRMRAVAR